MFNCKFNVVANLKLPSLAKVNIEVALYPPGRKKSNFNFFPICDIDFYLIEMKYQTPPGGDAFLLIEIVIERYRMSPTRNHYRASTTVVWLSD